MQPKVLNSEISTRFDISFHSYMVCLCVYNKNDHAVPSLKRSSNYASACVSKTVRNMHQIIYLRFTNYFLNNFQCIYPA